MQHQGVEAKQAVHRRAAQASGGAVCWEQSYDECGSAALGRRVNPEAVAQMDAAAPLSNAGLAPEAVARLDAAAPL
ncbi:hypothetical protein GCM10027269_81960 [Kribbella endophytica]